MNEQSNEGQGEGLSMGQAVDTVGDEQAAALASLVAKTGPEPSAEPGAEGVVEVEQRAPLAEEVADAINAAVSMLEPMFPTLVTVYTPTRVQAIGKATERVCIKRGWLQNGLFGGQSEEIVLAGVLVPVALGTWAAVKADMVAARVAQKPWVGWFVRVRDWWGGKRQPSQEQAESTPGASNVTMGTVAAS